MKAKVPFDAGVVEVVADMAESAFTDDESVAAVASETSAALEDAVAVSVENVEAALNENVGVKENVGGGRDMLDSEEDALGVKEKELAAALELKEKVDSDEKAKAEPSADGDESGAAT